MSQPVRTCENCGTTWFLETAEGGSSAGVACPVCHLAISDDAARLVPLDTITDLEGELGSLVRRALASGLTPPAVMLALRDELAFAAELGHAGRRFFVQVVDLGPEEEERLGRPLRDGRDLTSLRGTGS